MRLLNPFNKVDAITVMERLIANNIRTRGQVRNDILEWTRDELKKKAKKSKESLTVNDLIARIDFTKKPQYKAKCLAFGVDLPIIQNMARQALNKEK